MHFIIKYFPEITIKSKPVRRQFSQQLRDNLARLLRPVDASVTVRREWDQVVVQAETDQVRERVVEVLSNTPGIAYFQEVDRYPLVGLQDICDRAVAAHAAALAGKTFMVRCKRAGQHEFSSNDVERAVGAALVGASAARGVDLGHPQVTVRLEIRDEQVFLVRQRREGLGGFPIGAIDSVMSLVSGGFDSTVASFQAMRRGLRTHFLFFNLGGHAHEVGVKEAALYLWLKYGASHRVRFITVPFEEVVAELLSQVSDSLMGVLLKRMMLRAAEQIADEMGVQALVTGESVAQVSSQTLANLAAIDRVTSKLVLRPLATMDKREIIAIAQRIGTAELGAAMPEYCGVISVRPTTRAKPEEVAAEEARFDFAVLERALANRRICNIDEIDLDAEQAPTIETLAAPLANSVIIDLRHPDDVARKPLRLSSNKVLEIPFFELPNRMSELPVDRVCMLYCDQGVMSRLHAAHLKQRGYDNVAVYRPGR